MIRIVALGLLIGAGTAGSAQTAAPATPIVVVAAKPAKPKQICRTERVTGSAMAERTCHSAQAWADIDGGRAFDINNAASRLTSINHVPGDVTGSTAGLLPRPVGH